jgi:hypothetical protein
MRFAFAASALSTVVLGCAASSTSSPASTQYVTIAPAVSTTSRAVVPDAGPIPDLAIFDVRDLSGHPINSLAALGDAGVPFAHYLNAMHNRIHPIFTGQFLESLDKLSPTNPMNDSRLATMLEIVLNRDGSISKVGIIKTSGITAFDIATIDSVTRAAPFGSAPDAIVSPDDHVYLDWEFRREPVWACSTMNAHPILLKAAPNP